MKTFLKLAAVLSALAALAGAAWATTFNLATSSAYSCNGVQTAFTINFPYSSASDLLVTVNTSGVTSTLALATDYRLSAASTATTGTLTTVAASRCPNGSTLRIDRTTALTQPTSLRTQGSYDPATVEAALDRATRQIQETRAMVGVPISIPSLSDNTMITAASSTTARALSTWFADGYSVASFNAKGDGSTDDTAAVQAALTAASAGKTVYFEAGKTYKMNSSVTISKSLTLAGNGATVVVGTNTAFVVAASQVTITGFSMSSTATGTSVAAVITSASNSASGVRLTGNRFGRVSIYLWDANVNDTTAGLSNCRVDNNEFTGDYTGATPGDTYNIVDLRGCTETFILNNRFRVTNPERFLKISSSPRQVLIQGNTFVSTGGTNAKQAIDLFSDSRRVVVVGNIWDLTDTSSQGAQCMEEKTGDGTIYTSEPSEILVANNICLLNSTNSNSQLFGFYGSWGLATQTLAKSHVVISDNIGHLASSTSTNALITARGFTAASISGNSLWRDQQPNFAVGIEASNNRQISIRGNQVEYGYFLVNGAASHPSATTYVNQPQQVVIQGNQLRGFHDQGAVFLVNMTSTQDISILGNTLSSVTSSSSGGYVYMLNVSANRVTIEGNQGYTDVTSQDILASLTSVNNWNVKDNAWQTASSTWNPGTITSTSSAATNITVLGAQVGDAVTLGAPYDSQGCSFLARVSSSNNVQIIIWNFTGGSKTFASGTWRVTTSR